ncbi:MAG: efflux RND transporter periplasmic adaptor subunit [Capsulimonadales bacterium]|nr:efflux RND transporter periplasmic adaptor subunit [Capsulimonadales bacterium]
MSRLVARFWWIGLVVVAVGGVLFMRSRPRAIATAHPVRKTVVESLSVAGRARGQVETSVGAQVSGRVAGVPVREGDRVKAGQILARLDDTTLQQQARQAETAVLTAEAQVAQATDAIATAEANLTLASRRPLSSDIARLKADIAQNVAVAEAKLAGARQRLAELKEGATREVRQQILAQVAQAKANLEQAERDYRRQQELVREGAVAQSAADNAQTARDVAQKTYDNLIARQAEVTVGTRPEQLAQAEAEVRAAQATVAGARASGAAQLRSLLANPRPEDVRVARDRVAEARRGREVAEARLREARIALDVARSRLRDALVTAPFDGIVTQIVTEAGGVTGPNQPIVRLVRFSVPEIRIDLDEVNLGKIRLGQEAIVTSEAFPTRQFSARIREIGAQVDAERGTVEVRFDPVDPPDWLRPGQTVSVNIIVDQGTERWTVPLVAVTTVGGKSSMLVIENSRVVRKPIEIGSPGPEGVPVLTELTGKEEVVLNNTGVTVGMAATPQPTNDTAPKN